MTTDVATFASSEFTMRYRQPYTTEGLNKKLAGVQAPGCYRGFRLGVDSGAGDRTVDIVADTTFSDHLAVYETATGFSLTLRKTGGDFLIALTAYASQTVYVTIYATYAVGATTAAFLRIYTEAEYNAASEKDELIVLGKVDVPSAGNNITAAMIHNDGRSMAWQAKAPEAVAWSPLHRNAGFEFADDSAGTYEFASPGWRATVQSGTATLGPVSTDPNTGDKCLELNVTSGTVVFLVDQYLAVPVEEGQRLKISLWKKVLQAPTAGTITIVPYWMDDSGAQVVGTALTVDTAVDSAYEHVEYIIEVPTGLSVTHLSTVVLLGNGLTWASLPAAVFRLDDFQVWLEASADDPYRQDNVKSDLVAALMMLFDTSDDFTEIAKQAVFQFLSGSGVRLSRADKDLTQTTQPNLTLDGVLTSLGAGRLSTAAEARVARVTAPHKEALGEDFTLLWESADSAGVSDAPLRLYYSASGGLGRGLFVTYNATWNGSVWSQDLTAQVSAGFIFGETWAVYGLPGGSGTWASWSSPSYWSSIQVSSSSSTHHLEGGVEIGGELLSTAAQALVPRIATARSQFGTDERTLLWRSFGNPGGPHLYVYRAFSGANSECIEIVIGASWDGTDWDFDSGSGSIANRLVLSQYNFIVERKVGGANWSDVSWGDQYTLLEMFTPQKLRMKDGRIQFEGTTTASNPASGTTPVANTLYSKNIVKAYASILTGVTPPTVEDDFNLNQAGYSDSNWKLDMVFRTPLDTDDYAVVCTHATTTAGKVDWFCVVQDKTNTGFSVSVYEHTGSGWNDQLAQVERISMIVLGVDSS